MSFVKQSSALVLLAIAFINAPFSVWAQTLAPHQQLARDIHKELVEINTVRRQATLARPPRRWLRG